MALADLALLHPEEYVLDQNSNPANVKAEFEQLIARSNAVKDLAEQSVEDIDAVESDVAALDVRLTTAEGDIDTLEASVAAIEASITPESVLVVDDNETLDATLAADYSVLVVNGVGGPFRVTLGAVTDLVGRRFTIICYDADGAYLNTGTGVSNDEDNKDIFLANGDAVYVIAHGTNWLIHGPFRQEAKVVAVEPDVANTDTRVLTWASNKYQSLTLTSTSGEADLTLPAITAGHVGRSFVVACGYDTLGTQTLKVSASGTDRVGGATKTYYTMDASRVATFTASQVINRGGANSFIWLVSLSDQT